MNQLKTKLILLTLLLPLSALASLRANTNGNHANPSCEAQKFLGSLPDDQLLDSSLPEIYKAVAMYADPTVNPPSLPGPTYEYAPYESPYHYGSCELIIKMDDQPSTGIVEVSASNAKLFSAALSTENKDDFLKKIKTATAALRNALNNCGCSTL
jgi:hypothetical protein